MKACWAILLCIWAVGCQRTDWIIRTDPVLEPYVKEMVQRWQDQHPNGQSPEIFVQSSEFIQQGMRFGRPVDIAFIMEAGLTPNETGDVWAEREILGGDHPVWVQSAGGMLLTEGDSCLALPPTGNPLRQMVEAWKPGLGQNAKGCITFPQSIRLLNTYISQGKVKWAIMLGKDAAGMEGRIIPLAEGPIMPRFYQMALPKQTVPSEEAQLFFEFVRTEKSKISVGDFPTNM